jgi:thiamine-phosphate pyrophosphorylase
MKYQKALGDPATKSGAQESSRVLEELTKLSSIEDSENFKYIRYELYNLEIVLTKITSNSK